MRPLPPSLLAALAVLAPAFAVAAPRTIRLAPASATLEMRAYALGLLPLDARFGSFDGSLTYDPAAPARCSATLTATVASLETAKPATREAMLSPDFLDAGRFPTLMFRGTCTDAATLDGNLTMRGVGGNLAMRLERAAHAITAEGEIRRSAWGMDAKPLMVGPTIRIRVMTSLP
jgi:polyisoprenoid-binding protein YceI